MWDEPKRLANIADHHLDFADLDYAFFEDALVLPSYKGVGVASVNTSMM
jgi:uncharacterized DUF497 family protein